MGLARPWLSGTQIYACRKLVAAFPEFVSLKEKMTKSGPWKGIIKLGINGKWKKAYQSSQTSSLDGFMD